LSDKMRMKDKCLFLEDRRDFDITSNPPAVPPSAEPSVSPQGWCKTLSAREWQEPRSLSCAITFRVISICYDSLKASAAPLLGLSLAEPNGYSINSSERYLLITRHALPCTFLHRLLELMPA
jgi:hypothetical protein